MIKIRIKESKAFLKELHNLYHQKLDKTVYNLKDKPLNFKGARPLLQKAIKLAKPYKVEYTESQPTVYEPEEPGFSPEYYWTKSGDIDIYLDYIPNRKTRYNLAVLSHALNGGYGYILNIYTLEKQYRFY